MSAPENHPEWERNNALTAPSDRGDGIFRANVGAPALTEDQATEALKELVIDANITKFPKVERAFADPAIPLQVYGLVSFVPSKGAVPDKDGVYGMMKIRGNFATVPEADERAEFLIRNVDSYHGIYKCFVGRPFPITADPKYASKIDEVDIRKKQTEIISEDVKAKREQEKRDIEDVKERERRLLAEGKEDYKEDPYEHYTVLRVKKAQLVWGYHNTMKQLENMKQVIIRTREEIKKMDEENPDYASQHLERYLKARKDAGIPEGHTTEDNFVKYMVEDIDLGF